MFDEATTQTKHLPCPCRRHELDEEVFGLWWVRGGGDSVGTTEGGRVGRVGGGGF